MLHHHQMELEIDDLAKRDPAHSLKPLYLPIDPENEPKLYRKQDFDPPVFVKTTKGIEKVRPEGKFYFLLKFLPLELWYIIMEFKFVIEKYDFLDSVFYEQLEVESCAFPNLPIERKTEILEKEKEFKTLFEFFDKETLNGRYFPSGSIMDRIQYDIDTFENFERKMTNKSKNIGDTMFDLVLYTVKLFKKWFFILERSDVLMDSFLRRNYNKDLLSNYLNSTMSKIDELYAVSTSVATAYNYFSTPIITNSITNKKMCSLILQDLKYFVYNFNICCTYFDSPPDCETCYDYGIYFYKHKEWGHGLTAEIARNDLSEADDYHYYNRHWLEKDENDEYLIMVLEREGYYN